jgi:hypothetical protein
MAISTAAKRTMRMSRYDLVRGVLDGSSYCAMGLAVRVNATSVDDVILEIGGLPDERRSEVFNAVQDGFSVLADARCRDLL